MADTAKYYMVNVTGVVTKCLSCSLQKISQKTYLKRMKKQQKIQERDSILIYHQKGMIASVEEDIGQC